MTATYPSLYENVFFIVSYQSVRLYEKLYVYCSSESLGILNTTSRCIVLSSVSSTVLTFLISTIVTLGSHSDTQLRISAAILSSVYCVMPSYNRERRRDPNSGRRMRSPGVHVNMLRNEPNIAFTLTFFSTFHLLSARRPPFKEASIDMSVNTSNYFSGATELRSLPMKLSFVELNDMILFAIVYYLDYLLSSEQLNQFDCVAIFVGYGLTTSPD